MVSAVVLAAGCSKRMGKNKLLVKLDGKEILLRTLHAVVNSKVDEVIVVTGYQASDIQKIIQNLPVKIVYNPLYKEGQSTSVKVGVKAVNPNAKGVMFLLGDQPFVRPATINMLIDNFYSLEEYSIVVPYYKGKRGNPVLFESMLLPEIMKLTGDAGARSIITSNPDKVFKVDIESNEIVTDIDTPEDLKLAEEFLNLNSPAIPSITFEKAH